MACLGDFDEDDAEWQSLMLDITISNQETNILGDCDFDSNHVQNDSLDLDQWLDPNYFTGGSADLDREEAPSLAPPLYTAFSESERQVLHHLPKHQDEGQKLPETSIPELSSLVQQLRVE